MKIKHLFIFAAIIIISSINSETVSASVVDFPGNGLLVDMGLINTNQEGTISGVGIGGPISSLNVINGTLPTGSMITFSYSYPDAAFFSGASFIETSGSYSYEKDGQLFEGFAFSGDGNGPSLTFENGSIDGVMSDPLAMASAQIAGTNTATAVITNLSAGALDFASTLLAIMLGSKNYEITYNVSSVPIPAALPMFGLSLAALAGLRRRVKKPASSCGV